MAADPDDLIGRLNERTRTTPPHFPILSVSGGLCFLEVGDNQVQNGLLSALLRKQLESPNDGLVPEASADITNIVTAKRFRHRNDYFDYDRTNHGHLTRNQAVITTVCRWLRSAMAR